MTKGLQRSIRRGPPQDRGIITETFELRDFKITVDGATGIGFGTAVLADFHEGNIVFLAAVGNLIFAGPISGDLVDTWDGDYSVGTTATADSTLATTEIDVITSTTIPQAVAEVTANARGVSDQNDIGELHDNTDGSLELNLNMLIDDADISGDGVVITVNGAVKVSYLLMLDD